MVKVDVVEDAQQSMRRASWLAEQMAQVLCDEEVIEVAIAAALLTTGVIECYRGAHWMLTRRRAVSAMDWSIRDRFSTTRADITSRYKVRPM
jgi:hypothetical protein